jgi:hypothetical protein
MGCGASKANKDSNPNEIKSIMKPTKVLEFDQFFRTASDLLETLEDLRSTFEDTREEMMDIGRTDELAAPSLVEAFRVFFWSVSAHKKGEIKAAEIRSTSDPIAFTVDCSYMDWKTYDFSQAFMDMVSGITGAPAKILDLGQKAKEITERSAELSKDIPGAVKSAHLNPLDMAKATANAAVNFKTVAAGLGKIANIVKQVQDTIKDIKELFPKLADLILHADEVGKKAHEKSMLKIDEIFDHFQTAPKKTPEQVAAEKKSKKAKKHKRKGKKDAEKPKAEGQKAEGHKAVGQKAEGHAQAGAVHA